MKSVGLLVGIDALSARIDYTAQMNKPIEIAVTNGPTFVDSTRGRKLNGTNQRIRKLKPIISARSSGGWNATPAQSEGSALLGSCVKIKVSTARFELCKRTRQESVVKC